MVSSEEIIRSSSVSARFLIRINGLARLPWKKPSAVKSAKSTPCGLETARWDASHSFWRASYALYQHCKSCHIPTKRSSFTSHGQPSRSVLVQATAVSRQAPFSPDLPSSPAMAKTFQPFPASPGRIGACHSHCSRKPSGHARRLFYRHLTYLFYLCILFT